MDTPRLAERRIVVLRSCRVMLDADLAELYGVETRALNQAVKRNTERFPSDFMFVLTKDEVRRISQIVTSSRRGERLKFSKRVTAFTEHGVAMLSSVLRSRTASLVNIEIMRAFSRLRAAAAAHKDVNEKLATLEARVGSHDRSIQALFSAIRRLMRPSPAPRLRIGFKPSGTESP